MDFNFPGLTITCENAAELAAHNQDEFRKIRKNGLGASDSSIVLNVNPFPDSTESELIRQKNADKPTENEIKIGKMVNVRKGADLESLILGKFEKRWEAVVAKPPGQYSIDCAPYLTVNFDGVMDQGGHHNKIPVEVKFISTYGAKYYDFTKCVLPDSATPEEPQSAEENFGKYCKEMALQTGIPIYYYTQIQQQMLALDADYAFLTTIYDKDWETYTWIVFRDPRTQAELKMRGFKIWQKIEMLRGAK